MIWGLVASEAHKYMRSTGRARICSFRQTVSGSSSQHTLLAMTGRCGVARSCSLLCSSHWRFTGKVVRNCHILVRLRMADAASVSMSLEEDCKELRSMLKESKRPNVRQQMWRVLDILEVELARAQAAEVVAKPLAYAGYPAAATPAHVMVKPVGSGLGRRSQPSLRTWAALMSLRSPWMSSSRA